ncbi:SUMO-activating enzyme subunit 1 isoform X1 [Hyperolius riggenbachi]|uniref:SUMO-activating enzyme subunit 1 isoform X1 n=1 Tax=Hyperolius riggenbachi TaxID=752182 RepID=UPI0035A2A274
MVEKEQAVISEEEAAQYDRQIRLWGLEAQNRLRKSKVLLVGLGGLGAEVAKNLILAGVEQLTLLDHKVVSAEDSRAQFLIPTGSLGSNRAKASESRAQNLNPNVKVKVDTDNVEEKPEDFFKGFDAVCLTCCSRDLLVKVDQICYQNNIKFFAGDSFGYHGYMFADLGEHEFVEEKMKVTKANKDVEDGPEAKKSKIDSTESTMIKKKIDFCRLKDALEIDWSSEKAKAALKKTPADFFLLQVIMKFRTDKGRDPQPSTFQEDCDLLLQIRNDLLDSLGVNPDQLPDDFPSCFRLKGASAVTSSGQSWLATVPIVEREHSCVVEKIVQLHEGAHVEWDRRKPEPLPRRHTWESPKSLCEQNPHDIWQYLYCSHGASLQNGRLLRRVLCEILLAWQLETVVISHNAMRFTDSKLSGPWS